MTDQKRRYTTNNERGFLRQQFIKNPHPNNEEIICIAEGLNWTRSRVSRWFSNQRSRTPKHSKLLQELTTQKQMTNKLNEIYRKSLQQSDSRVKFLNWINYSIEGMKQDFQKSESKEGGVYNKIGIGMSHLQNMLVLQIENECSFLKEVKNLQSPDTSKTQKKEKLGHTRNENKNDKNNLENNKTNKNNKNKNSLPLRTNNFEIEAIQRIVNVNQNKILLNKNIKKNDHNLFLSDRKRKKSQHTGTTTDKQSLITKQPFLKIKQKLQPIPRNNIPNENMIPLTHKLREELSNSKKQSSIHTQTKTLQQIELENQLSLHLNRIIQTQSKNKNIRQLQQNQVFK
ncbi:hypothetical protein M0813_05502 [Anaeramoeba flamelloides]|uniref:Homeobox domain-containing protein n=1 Tax=Anaeramoeba flamelloides TaxID=1746091 RepID=A0ABQ8XGT2_9EUKA|nr:hypothetical protein M0813_05502 [Anaeramoeba flamelloides]